MPVVDDEDVTVGGAVGETGHEIVGVALSKPVEVERHPTPTHHHEARLRGANEHGDAAMPGVRTKGPARLVSGFQFQSRCCFLDGTGHVGRALEHELARMPMNRHAMTFIECAPHDRHGLWCDVLVDDKEGCPDLV